MKKLGMTFVFVLVGAGVGAAILLTANKTETVQGYFQRAGDLCGLSEVQRPAPGANASDPEATLRELDVTVLLDRDFCKQKIEPGSHLTVHGIRVSSEEATGRKIPNMTCYLVR